ncbi:hypothetical protein CAMGR0001_1011 [Campylobacter gracilis RM3268]|uniref:Uncharacterized protein n=1 Tax=Campylobacter gracilis RM3268 TaxID=553220 RepID=C8PGL7_9BACT|nr:hypothetical protein CAMGR0001_1011 [Campylobacter gracilis RM3268]
MLLVSCYKECASSARLWQSTATAVNFKELILFFVTKFRVKFHTLPNFSRLISSR